MTAEVRGLLEALEKGDRHERAAAAVELGQRGVEEAGPALEAMLDDTDDLVAITALFGAWNLGREDVPVERAAAGLASPDEEIMQTAVHVICEMGEGAVPGLLALLQSSSPHSQQIVRILGDVGGAQAREELERLSRSDDPELAATASSALED